MNHFDAVLSGLVVGCLITLTIIWARREIKHCSLAMTKLKEDYKNYKPTFSDTLDYLESDLLEMAKDEVIENLEERVSDLDDKLDHWIQVFMATARDGNYTSAVDLEPVLDMAEKVADQLVHFDRTLYKGFDVKKFKSDCLNFMLPPTLPPASK